MATDATEELRTGLEVRGADGRRLGTLVGLESGALVVERGFFWPKRFIISRSDVGTVEGGEVRLLEGAAPREVPDGHEAAASSGPEELVTPGEPVSGMRVSEDADEVRVPLAREEAWPRVHTRGVGAVRVRKVVRTEVQHLTVEVRREELVIERLPVQAGDSGLPASASGAFEESEQIIPLWREDVEVVKRPFIYEEVHLKKAVERRTWTEEVPLRREEARVEEEGETRPTHGVMNPDTSSH